MKMFSRFVFATVLALAPPLAAVRADAQLAAPQGAAESDLAARLAAAKELFDLVSKDTLGQVVGQVTGQVWPQVEASLRAKNPNIDVAALAELRKEFERIQLEYLGDLLKDAPSIYARHFTDQELREIVAFYHTAIGAKTLKEMPQVMGEVMAMLMPRMKDVMSQTQDAFLKVLRRRGYTI